MGPRVRLAAAAALVFLHAAYGAAQAQAPASREDEIVVTGEPMRRMVWDFLSEVSVTPSREDQLPRWNGRVCPGVVGLPARQGQFIIDRIARRADAVGLRAGAPGCRADVLVLVTREPGELAQALAERERFLMANYGVQEHVGTRGEEALEDFVVTARPVRWWHVTQSATEDGRVLGHVQYAGGAADIPGNHPDFETTRRHNASRLHRNLRQDFRNVLIIVDAERARGTRLEALSDYLAMVALGQIDPAADTSPYPSILNLFAGAGPARAGPARMTDWDLAYLEGLYSARRNAANSQAQARDIRRRMTGRLSPEN
jgi:hypothetical protein